MAANNLGRWRNIDRKNVKEVKQSSIIQIGQLNELFGGAAPTLVSGDMPNAIGIGSDGKLFVNVSAAGGISDVRLNGASVVSGGIANVTAAQTSDITTAINAEVLARDQAISDAVAPLNTAVTQLTDDLTDGLADVLPLAGGTMSGSIDLQNWNINNAGWVNTKNIGAAAGSTVFVHNTTDFRDNNIVEVADPVNAQDAATKNYVDTTVTNAVATAVAGVDPTPYDLASGQFGSTADNVVVTISNVKGTAVQATIPPATAVSAGAMSSTAYGKITDLNTRVTALEAGGGGGGTPAYPPIATDTQAGIVLSDPTTPGNVSVDLNGTMTVNGAALATDLADYLPLTGGTISGETIINAPLRVNGAVVTETIQTSSYDPTGTTQLALLTGSNVIVKNLSGDPAKIVNVEDPTDPQDVATKQYVDDATGSLSNYIQIPNPLPSVTSVAQLLPNGTLSFSPVTWDQLRDGILTDLPAVKTDITNLQATDAGLQTQIDDINAINVDAQIAAHNDDATAHAALNIPRQASDIGAATPLYVDTGISTHNADALAHSSIIAPIQDVIPSTASSTNQLADQDFVNSSIENMASNYITPTAAGDTQFASLADLQAGPWYHRGQPKTPTNNDFAMVLTGTAPNDEQWRAQFDGTQWNLLYKINDTPFTAAQLAAINSGVTVAYVAQIDQNSDDISTLKNDVLTNTSYKASGPSDAAGIPAANALALNGRADTTFADAIHNHNASTVFTSGAVPVAYGGTGLSSQAAGNMRYATNTTTSTMIAPPTANVKQVLMHEGTVATAPTWQDFTAVAGNDIATTTTPGTVKASAKQGEVAVDSTGIMTLNGGAFPVGNPPKASNGGILTGARLYADWIQSTQGGSFGVAFDSDLYLYNHAVYGLRDPVSDSDAANKRYVDSMASPFVQLAVGTGQTDGVALLAAIRAHRNDVHYDGTSGNGKFALGFVARVYTGATQSPVTGTAAGVLVSGTYYVGDSTSNDVIIIYTA